MSAVFFGDGAIEEGTYHECLNFASLKQLPVIFVCENNFFSSHLHLSERQPADNIYETAAAHAMPGVRVDGNDVIEVSLTARNAVEQARSGRGPTLIEARTYRWRGHVGPNWDLDKAIRTKEEVESWIARDPIPRLRHYIASSDGVRDRLQEIDRRVEVEIDAAVTFARQAPYPDPSELTDFIFRS